MEKTENSLTSSCTDPYALLSRWLHRCGFSPAAWKLGISAPSRECGWQERGIHATADIVISSSAASAASAPLLSIPSALVITPEKVRASSTTRRLLSAQSLSLLSAEQLLILFLVLQRRQGEQSSFCPYLSLLPVSYSSLEWWTEAEVRLLPDWEEQPLHSYRHRCNAVRRDWRQLNSLLTVQHLALHRCRYDSDALSSSSSSPLPLSMRNHCLPAPGHPLCVAETSASSPVPHFHCLISLAEYQWAFSTVATRSCYWPTAAPASASSSFSPSPAFGQTVKGDVSCCLVPFLDMLNHSSTLLSSCRLSPSSQRYELHCREREPEVSEALLRVRRGDEVRICYGELSNWELLTRYGFVLNDSGDEQIAVTQRQIETLIAAMQSRSSSTRRPTRSAALQPLAAPASSAASCSSASSIRCCCGRTVLPSSLTACSASSPSSASVPELGLSPLSAKHAVLLAHCGLYSALSFSLTCCQPQWPLLTYCRVRSVLTQTGEGAEITGEEMGRLKAGLAAAEEEHETGGAGGWLDAEHERRGRALLIAVARWVERQLAAPAEDGRMRSVQDEADELERLRQREAEAAEVEEAAGAGCVTLQARVLALRYRLVRRRLLLGLIHQQEQAVRRLTADDAAAAYE